MANDATTTTAMPTLPVRHPSHVDARRRQMVGACMGFLFVSTCEAAPMSAILDVVVFNYLDRPIFDIFIDRKVGESSDVYPRTGGSTVTGVKFNLGPKTISWRLDGPEGTARNGDTVVAKNAPSLAAPPAGAKYLGVHIYPDDTVELLTSKHYPRPSPRGDIEIERLEKRHGK